MSDQRPLAVKQQRVVVVSGGDRGVVSSFTAGDPDYYAHPNDIRKDALTFAIDQGWMVTSTMGAGCAAPYGSNWLVVLEK
ncbi:hypothetical protein [Paraburkholderia terrae]|uniref:Uncharacterized protein n=1 Tax=Paraburkholderia terrae TaxID=311230 RepID=A0A2I8F3D2_9BURK|nr:hypothetical protein [Paraburkholderia terrae]AUT66283.1 hypothetical protein C2L65_41805 [Paraburkholderia terrae]